MNQKFVAPVLSENENKPHGSSSFHPWKARKYALNLSRANFVSLAWKSLLATTGILGLRGLWDFMSYQPDPSPPTIFDLGPMEEISSSSITTFPEAHAVVVRQGEVLSAFSTVCPHLGCTVEMEADGFTCPCHGSQFSSLGALLRGPAARPLRPLKLEVNDQGHLILDTAEA